jgi:putative component of membrane protein insertase Oxa1/YidC/SpoIIIJ protein YidD
MSGRAACPSRGLPVFNWPASELRHSPARGTECRHIHQCRQYNGSTVAVHGSTNSAKGVTIQLFYVNACFSYFVCSIIINGRFAAVVVTSFILNCGSMVGDGCAKHDMSPYVAVVSVYPSVCHVGGPCSNGNRELQPLLHFPKLWAYHHHDVWE